LNRAVSVSRSREATKDFAEDEFANALREHVTDKQKARKEKIDFPQLAQLFVQRAWTNRQARRARAQAARSDTRRNLP
jgi:hypothetical protein